MTGYQRLCQLVMAAIIDWRSPKMKYARDLRGVVRRALVAAGCAMGLLVMSASFGGCARREESTSPSPANHALPDQGIPALDLNAADGLETASFALG